MIKSIEVINSSGESLLMELTKPEQSGFLVVSVEGLGPAKANINLTELTGSDGSTFNSARLDERNIVITAALLPKPTIEDTRLLSYKYFPIKRKVTIKIETDTRKVRIDGYIESNEPVIFSQNESIEISIICPNPYFYEDDAAGKQTTVFYGLTPLFEFPFSNESLNDPLLEFGKIQNYTEQTVLYDGDADTGITITMYAIGEVKNIGIFNTLTREEMHLDTTKIETLTGHGIKSGDTIIISTIIGDKMVTLLRDGVYTNILNCIDKNSDWFQITKGDNVFAYTAEEGISNLQFRIENDVLYEGV